MAPAAGSATAFRTSSTDNGLSRNSASRITVTQPSYRVARALRPAAAAARVPDNGGGADDRHRGAGRGDGGVLAVQPAARDGVMPGPLVEQEGDGARVVVTGPPARCVQRL